MFTPLEAAALLRLCRQQRDTPRHEAEHALGHILVASGEITQAQLEGALICQATSGRHLGEELIRAGHASSAQVEGGLRRQRRLVSYALASTIGFAPLAALPLPAHGGQQSTTLLVSVTVRPHATLHQLYLPSQLSVSEADIARGFVDLAAASRFTVSTNSRAGYLIAFLPVGNLFDSVLIGGLGNAVELGADGGYVVRRFPLPPDLAHELSFRFTLRPNARPGRYPWPLQLAVRPL